MIIEEERESLFPRFSFKLEEKHILSKVKNKQYLGIELNLISLLFSSISPVLNKFSLVSLSPVLGGFLTSFFAATFTLILLLVMYHNLSFIKNKVVIILGLTNAIGIILQYIALSNLSPVTVTLIARIYLVYVFILGALFLKERIRAWDYVAIVACILGSILVSSNRFQLDDSLVGIICAFIYPLMYAANNIAAKYLVDDYRPTDVLFYNHLVSAGFLLLYLLFNLGSIGKVPVQGVAFNFAGAFCNGFMSLLLFYTGLKYITAGHANIVRALGPLVVIVYSYFFFPVAITPQIIGGAVLLIVATTIVTVNSRD